MSKPIWTSGVKIPVLGATGEYSSGKSLLIVTIDPAHTKIWDWEQSLGCYESLGFERINVPEELQKLYPDGYSQVDAFVWWRDQVLATEAGVYSVLGVDPISDIEEGLVEWVKSRHKEWGFKTEESFVATGGIFWSKVKAEWKKVLVDLSVRCQTFAFTTHLKQVWKGGKATSETTAKGKSTLRELASLFLHMERPPQQTVPSARVLKTRLAVAKVVDDEVSIVPVLPPRLPIATPKAIRKYILDPPDYAKLSEDEQQHEKQMTEAEKLELQREIAEQNRLAAEANAKAEDARDRARKARESAIAAARGEVQQESDKSASKPSDEATLSVRCTNLFTEMKSFGVDQKVLARDIYKVLKARDVDVSDFKSPDDVEKFFVQLTEDELFELKQKFDNLKLAY